MMKKALYTLALLFSVFTTASAAPGDTTWVDATNAQLSWFGAYDSTIVLPHGKTYRNIYMIFTLGKYMCPGYNPANPGTGTGGTGWCGDWDYTVLNYIITPGGQSYELGRFITPYANALNPRTPWTATQNYVYDVTDYAPVLHDTATIRIFFSGYSGGFTGKIRFAFIEGTPDRDVTGIRRLWTGSYGYGGTPDINSHFTPVVDSAPAYTESAAMKFIVTGHGSDGNGCCEFMSHNYQVVLNGSSIANQAIWRSDCGMNELYPQSGTWVFERGNWCPGAIVHDNWHTLPGIRAGSKFRIGLQFDPYSGGGSYTTEAILFYYGAMKKTLDASIDQVVAPTSDENFFRENPTSGSPIVKVKNRGIATINNITFQYGLKGGAMASYTWYGALATFGEREVTLPALGELATIAGDTLVHTFVAKIVAVNGSIDADSTNNTATSKFLAAPFWPSTFRIQMSTGNLSLSSNPTLSEFSWAIYDKNNTIVATRNNAQISKTYLDTVMLHTGYYKLVISDSSCFGLAWWLDGQLGVAPGSFFVKKLKSATNIPMRGYSYSGGYNNDFGCGYSQYFYTVDSAQGITNIAENGLSLEVYPTPAQDNINVDITGIANVKGRLQLIDALGRVIMEKSCNGANQQISVRDMANGLYTLVYVDDNRMNRLTGRVLVAR